MSLLFPVGPNIPPPGGGVPFEHPFDVQPDADGIDLFAEEASEFSAPEILAQPCGFTFSTLLCDCLETVSSLYCYGSAGGDSSGCGGCGDGGCGGDSDGGCGGCGDTGTGGDTGGDPS